MHSPIQSSARLAARLEWRLNAYFDAAEKEGQVRIDSVEDQTGECALATLHDIHVAVASQEDKRPSADELPVLGARDLRTLRTLLSIVATWRLAALVNKFDISLGALQSASVTSHAPAKLEEVPDEETLCARRKAEVERYNSTCSAMADTLSTMRDVAGLDSLRSEVSNAVLHTCAPHMVALAIRVAWGPAVQGESKKEALSLLTGLLKVLSTASSLKTLSAAGHIAPASSVGGPQSAIPAFVKAATERLYSAQLLRTDAVMALFKITFGEDEEHGSGLMRKLVSTSHLLSTPPVGMAIGTFVPLVVQRLMEVVSPLPADERPLQSPSHQSTTTHKTAACYALARLHEVAPSAVDTATNTLIWEHLLPANRTTSTVERLSAAILLLFQLVEHSEPSALFLCFLIRPAVVPLFTLLSFLQSRRGPSVAEVKGKQRNTDVEMQEVSRSLLLTWLRLAELHEAGEVLRLSNLDGLFAVEGSSVGAVKGCPDDEDHPHWAWHDGYLTLVWQASASQPDLPSALSSLSIADLQPILHADGEAESLPPALLSALHLAPSPRLLSSLLKEASRKDVAAELLHGLLDAYALAKQSQNSLKSGDDGSTKGVLYVQHILEIINVFGSEVLSGQADKILAFINFALSGSHAEREEESRKGSRREESLLAGLTNVAGHKGSVEFEDAEDDQDDELAETALNLLLSLLEGEAHISSETHSILAIIAPKLDWQASNAHSEEIRALAREARLVLTARRSSKVAPTVAKSGTALERAFAQGNVTYQEALRLLQDPILPVRAHGLVLLKELAACGSNDLSKDKLMDPALTPAILDIYMQAIQDDESFLYLNAVKGIAEMANTGGRAMIKRLVGLYLGGQQQQARSRSEVDKQLRVGEALLQVVQRLEEALSPHVDVIVEPLLTALRDARRPTTLRSSYLSILGTCVEACPAAFSSTQLGGTIADAMLDAMLDLLSVETSPRHTQHDEVQERDNMQDPTHLDARLPQLRRAAILLLALLIRGSRHQLESSQEREADILAQQDGLSVLRMPNGSILGGPANDTRDSASAPPALLFGHDKAARTSSVLSYVEQTDSDGLVRHQAGELLDELRLLTLAEQASWK